MGAHRNVQAANEARRRHAREAKELARKAKSDAKRARRLTRAEQEWATGEEVTGA